MLPETIKTKSGKRWLLTENKVYLSLDSAKAAAKKAIGDNFYPTWDVKYIPAENEHGQHGHAVYVRISEKQEYRKKISGWTLTADTPNNKIWESKTVITVGYPQEMFREGTEKSRTGDSTKIHKTVNVYQDGNSWKVMLTPLLNKNEIHISARDVRSRVFIFNELGEALKQAIEYMKKNR
jgi:hypothetical protein